MVIDLKRCVGCNACTLACKQEQGTPAEMHFARVVTREVGAYPATKRTFLPVLCNHCQEAPCEQVCPTGATYIRADGIVMVEQKKCIGCRACAVACPYMNRHFIEDGMLHNGRGPKNPYEAVKMADYEEGTMTKCTLCAHLTCPSEARIFGDWDEEDGQLQELVRERESWELLPEAGTKPSVIYLDQ
jgi:molybdopterin-containing oxidoreductase family iron-sulfur binding subunit